MLIYLVITNIIRTFVLKLNRDILSGRIYERFESFIPTKLYIGGSSLTILNEWIKISPCGKKDLTNLTGGIDIEMEDELHGCARPT